MFLLAKRVRNGTATHRCSLSHSPKCTGHTTWLSREHLAETGLLLAVRNGTYIHRVTLSYVSLAAGNIRSRRAHAFMLLFHGAPREEEASGWVTV